MAMSIQLTKQQMQALVGGVVIFGVVGYCYCTYFWFPVSERIDKAQAEIERLDGEITKAKGQAARLPEIQKKLELAQQQAADAEQRLPRVKDVPAVIDTLSRLSRKYQVELNSFTPGPLAAKQFFTEIPYSLGVSGTYHDVGRF